ncbi:semaphorin-4B isoform X1 [Mirounga leonina]|uniref:semaphorin-4B isoform X1 n=1 Tax=Mirounga leonina TaxID=9715 RepID=UPI00156BF74B|nr:semaphorin-4B isoform X1 [Mirounga leonina]XP_034880038.1 semaphorin-4B isoform X1 [Mirounga leonina]XP_034880039.1 semaphorin-4B isoform X1 [Mirounga leonina]XP_034880040.1 semaphorin-4B isoform X1 [Mirounga leonina]XP_034880041.1 semaphorin-4B isoform X1 [Mirounga leonina]
MGRGSRPCAPRGALPPRLPPLLLLLLLLLLPPPPTPALAPRISLPLGSQERPFLRFGVENVSNYTALLLSRDGKTLYVGAREALFALNTSASFLPGGVHQELPWSADAERRQQCSFKGKDPRRDCQNYIKILLPLNSTHLFTCGTAAFSPVCTYINVENFTLAQDEVGHILLEDGKGRCPFDPNFKSTALVVDGELYTGTVSSFQGNDPAISRSQSLRPTKTESSLNWLQDPAFVASAYIPESLGSLEGDDDKIYFFFSETGQEFEFFENTIVSRVARICKGDEGGERVLQQRWTSFLKAQLLCSRPDDGFPFNVLQDVFTLSPSPQDWHDTLFYGVFTSQWHGGTTEGSAVCVFTMKDVQNAFSGLYKEVNRETQQWYTVTHPVPTPRPGACITNSARERRITSSLQLPDRVLNFLKDHFLMDGQVRSRLLLLQPRARYQRVAVHRVPGLHRTYDVLFLGTGDGRLHKAVAVGSRVHIIEELQIFPPGQPVQNLLLDATRGLLYAAASSGVVQVPVANCSLYQSCGDCVLARDPYCAWSNSRCRHISLYRSETASRPWIQDIEGANTRDLCNTSSPGPRSSVLTGEKRCEQVYFQPNTVNTLACPLLSNLATRLWLHNGLPVNASASCRVLPTGDLLLVGSQQELGVFQCWSLEEGFRQLVACYYPKVVDDVLADRADRSGSMPVVISTSRVSAPAGGKAGWGVDKSYWTEFLVMCTLFVFAVVLFILFFLYRHRGGMKVFLKQGECASVHPKARPVALPPETRPLNGVGPPSTPLDHRGYQALSDSSPAPRVFTESEKRPLSIQDSFVEVSPVCPRPRVRLGSEIRDSVV